MTAAFLQSELSTLIQESKRKYVDVRKTSEKSLSELKNISVTSETQLAGDLARKDHFIEPFLLACLSKNLKLAVSGTICLQRLIASSAVPRARLSSVLDAFQEAVTLALEVQLKILQTLPSLLQLYAQELHGSVLAKTISLSAGLVGSKTSLVSGTATATFQQLINGVFERLDPSTSFGTHDKDPNASPVAAVLQDCSLVFHDFCATISGDQTKFMNVGGLTQPIVLDTLESLLLNQGSELFNIAQCFDDCRTILIPAVVKILESTTRFDLAVRSFRISSLLSAQFREHFTHELESLLRSVLNILDRRNIPKWRRVLCLEFFRGLTADFDAIRDAFCAYDLEEGKSNVVTNLMAVLVRIAAEDPLLIGLGRQSTLPSKSSETASEPSSAVDFPGVDTAANAVLQSASSTAGISAEWSTVEMPCIAQSERSAPPEFHDTYVHVLVLGCAGAFSDGLSKFIMPMSLPERSSSRQGKLEGSDDIPVTPGQDSTATHQASLTNKYQTLVNPLKKSDSPNYSEIQACARMVEACWPAVLAICSTYLNAALDSYFYHNLVRTVQKLTQVSGVLELNTPRDALLTTLAKVTVPANITNLINLLYGDQPAKLSGPQANQENGVETPSSPSLGAPNNQAEQFSQSLNVRHLLCLRALLNLGIALGPTLGQSAWSIILQSLQQVDALMSVGPTAKIAALALSGRPEDENSSQGNLAAEIQAVGTATKRMMESTKTYPYSSLRDIAEALYKMVEDVLPSKPVNATATVAGLGPGSALASQDLKVSHKASRSVSGNWTKPRSLQIEVAFVLKTVNDLARINAFRFVAAESAAVSWNLFTVPLLSLMGDEDLDSQLRVRAASIVDMASVEMANIITPEDLKSIPNVLESQALASLKTQIQHLNKIAESKGTSSHAADAEICQRLLGALEGIVSQCGDSLQSSWQTVFSILQEALQQKPITTARASDVLEVTTDGPRSAKIVSSSFRIVQLIVSDFSNDLHAVHLASLVTLFYGFGAQKQDLNMSLATTSLFWNINSLILERTESIDGTTDDPIQLLMDNGKPAESPSTWSALWQFCLASLAKLCRDSRAEVRDPSTRMLVEMTQASSQLLTPFAWNLSIRDAFLPLVRWYMTHQDSSKDTWQDSALQLILNLGVLLRENLLQITGYHTFDETWLTYIKTMEIFLETQSLTQSASIFGLLQDDLQALSLLRQNANHFVMKRIVHPVWDLWAKFHPSGIPTGQESNQASLVAHARTLKGLNALVPLYSDAYSCTEQHAVSTISAAIEGTVFSCVQPRYENDTAKLAVEQEAAVDNVKLLAPVMVNDEKRYAEFILGLTVRSLDANDEALQTKVQTLPKSKSRSAEVHRPTFIAFMRRCLELLEDVIKHSILEMHVIDVIPVGDTLKTLNRIIQSKYGPLPADPKSPLWQHATGCTVTLLGGVKKEVDRLSKNEIGQLAGYINVTCHAVLNAPYLEAQDLNPLSDVIVTGEFFDVKHFELVREVIQPVLQHEYCSDTARREYILTLFHASLVAKPWHGDLPEDLENNSLGNFSRVRVGSLRKPDYPKRRQIFRGALEILLESVSTSHPGSDAESEKQRKRDMERLGLAQVAAPYVLLRIAHPIKVFLADQRLRQLTPPPIALQEELYLILTAALSLQSDRRSFNKLGKGSVSSRGRGDGGDDGKMHLRILHPLAQRLKDFWERLPRLKPRAWQDDKYGQGIAEALTRWNTKISEDWSID